MYTFPCKSVPQVGVIANQCCPNVGDWSPAGAAVFALAWPNIYISKWHNYIIFMDNHFIGSERTPSGNCIENHLSPLSQEKLTCFLLKRNNLCPFYSDLCLFLLSLNNVIFQTFWPSKENAEHSRLEGKNKGNCAAAKSHIWICILILQCWPNIFSY